MPWLGSAPTANAVQDYWHHWEDVTVGFFLGLTVAYMFYRQAFTGLTDPKAGQLLQPQLEGSASPMQFIGFTVMLQHAHGCHAQCLMHLHQLCVLNDQCCSLLVIVS